jgi:uncharacterized membrane protein
MVCVVIFQVFTYLKIGIWQQVSLIDTLIVIGGESQWLTNPKSWIGLWKIFNFIPLTVFLLFVAFVLNSIEEGR